MTAPSTITLTIAPVAARDAATMTDVPLSYQVPTLEEMHAVNEQERYGLPAAIVEDMYQGSQKNLCYTLTMRAGAFAYYDLIELAVVGWLSVARVADDDRLDVVRYLLERLGDAGVTIDGPSLDDLLAAARRWQAQGATPYNAYIAACCEWDNATMGSKVDPSALAMGEGIRFLP